MAGEPRVPLSYRVLKELRRRINSGRYPPGRPLPEGKTAEELRNAFDLKKLSRTSVHQALVFLETEGLVCPGADGAWEVCRPTPDEVREVYLIRIALEPLVIRRLVGIGNADKLKELDDLLVKMDEAIDAGDTTTFLELDTRFHCRIAGIAGFGMIEHILSNIRGKMLVFGHEAMEDHEFLRAAVEEHRQLITAIRNGEVQRACDIATEHISHSARTVGLEQIEL